MKRSGVWLAALLAIGCDDGGAEAGADGDARVDGQAGAGGGGEGGGGAGGGGAGGEGAGGEGAGGEGGAGGGGPSCTEGTVYQPGTPMFVERTEAWGLRRLGVQGTMLTVADVDGDGFADLVARRGGVVADLYPPVVPGRSALHWSWRDVDSGLQHQIDAESWRIGAGDTLQTYTLERLEGGGSAGSPPAEPGFAVLANTSGTGADGAFSRFDFRFEQGALVVCRSVTDAADAEAAAAAASALDACPEGRGWTVTPDGRHHWVLRNTGRGFEDVTRASGLFAPRGTYETEVGRPAWVVAFADVDNDGDLDAYTGFDTRNPVKVVDPDLGEITLRETSEVLLNDGAGRFTLAPEGEALRLRGAVDVPSGAAFTDFDRDGNVDLWQSQGGLGAPFQDRLWRNNGGGAFADVTADAGLTTLPWEGRTTLADLNAALGNTTAWSAAACDLNDDGAPELLAASYGRAPNHLWQAGRDGNRVTYSNASVASGYAYDENLSWDDNQFARCFCAANRGADGCAETPPPDVGCGQPNWTHSNDRQPFRLGGNSGATVCADFDGDGQLDLYTTEIRHWWAGDGSDVGEVLLNRTGDDGAVRFERPGRAALGMAIDHPPFNWDEGHITAGVLDADNDGRVDIYAGATDYAGNRGRLYVNVSAAGAPQFVEVPVGDFFEHNRSHGIAVADFDRDGDLDVIVGHSRARCDAAAPNNCYPTQTMRFFENTVGQGGNWFQLDLRGGAGSNRLAIGAQVTVRTADGWVQRQEVSGGYGHFGAQPDRVLHFGLGAHCDAEITVRWPDASGTTQTFTMLGGQRYRLVQGAEPESLPPPAR